MVELPTEDKMSQVQECLAQFGDDKESFWLGLCDTKLEGTWVWDYSKGPGGPNENNWTNWKKGEPNNGHTRAGEFTGVEDCAEMVKANNWKWDDTKCEAQLHALCELN